MTCRPEDRRTLEIKLDHAERAAAVYHHSWKYAVDQAGRDYYHRKLATEYREIERCRARLAEIA